MLATHPVIGLGAFAAACLLLLFVCVTIATMRMLTRPPRRTYATALGSGRPGDPSELSAPPSHPSHIWSWKHWTFRSRNLDLPVWEIEGLNPSGPTIILTHGWGDSKIGALVRITNLAPLASRLIAWDLPGQGDAPGTCALGTHEVTDLASLIDHLKSNARSSIVLFGWSLGAGVSIATAASATSASPHIAAVIAENPYRLAITPAANVLRLATLPHSLALRAALRLLEFLRFTPGLAHPDFDRLAHAKRLIIPLLVVHGEIDNVCPLTDGRDIAAAAPNATLHIIQGGGHHGLWTGSTTQPQVFEAVRAFLQTLPPR